MSYTKEDIARATALLNDPIRFGEYVMLDLFSLEILGPIFQDQPRQAWKNRDKAFRLIRRATGVPGADLPHLVGDAWDLSNDLVTSVTWRERALTLAVERLRQDLIAIRERFDAPLPADISAAVRLRKIEAELDRLSEAEDDRRVSHAS